MMIMMHNFNVPHQETSTPIDGTLIAPSLSKELVSTARIEGMIMMANATLVADGVETTVNGIPAVVSEVSVEVIVPKPGYAPSNAPQQQLYHVRAARLQPTSARKDKVNPLPALVFSESDDLPVITPNPNALRFVELVKGPSLVADMSQLEPDVDSPAQVEWTMSVLTRLAEKIEAIDTAEEAALQAEQKHLQQEHATRRQHRRSIMKQVGGMTLKWGGGLLGATAAVTGLVYGIGKIDIEPRQDIDDRLKRTQLAGGTVFTLGSTESTPEFSRQAYEDSLLGRNIIPYLDLNSDRTSPKISSSQDNSLGLDDTYREIVLTSSKPGKNCEEASVDKVPLDTRLVTWTDFAGPTGQSRADEFKVKYEVGKVKVCWNGEERTIDEDPRVIVALRPASSSQPR